MTPETLTIALTALLVDALIGWPDALYRRISHPVVWIGRLISALDARWNRGRHRIARGAVAVAVTLGAAVIPALLLTWALAGLPFGPVILGVLAWPLVATRSLHDHVAAVARPLAAGDVPAARAAVAMIVGRDLDDRPEPIARAALESLAENASDGVVAPLFWAAVAGLPGIAAYKAINTLDSMIGHMSPRHALFGRVAARLDDLVNLPASRLTGLLFVAAAGSRRAWRVMRRDAHRHRSPNAGWPEGAMAGALDVRLSGPRRYHGVESLEPWLNAGARDPGAADLLRGLALYRRAMALLGLGLALALAL
ncbi:cobalamin biosynthesis protein CobD [Paracoccus versutus]|uniref:Cobalamin biosynthesis protein CobD n=1 Tax=Paracoccus versutus TaxID=34007 RepID=A0AAQ0HIK9_PARVE|nr:adenosylcobinamide-phosphate synthase CbiB [Paracoccus versutus]KGJ06061.1 cobalamin biosynthesis protein CobD [Paracoccus versutus]REG46930.1 adenosylcobinamide-phosphate synthase [Paracoccus versutus]WEJ79153.1 cobalamin biosynthesis protein CobD [Paracoccus versutus]